MAGVNELLPGEERPTTFFNLLAVTPIDPTSPNATTFRSVSKGLRAGNVQPFAYGGYIQGLCINAAAATLPKATPSKPSFALSSFAGTFMGPTLTTTHVTLTVTVLRSTRSFHTCLVLASQSDPKNPSAPPRSTFHATADFHVREPESMTYGAAPRFPYTSVENLTPFMDHLNARVDAGTLAPALRAAFIGTFGSFDYVIQRRDCPEGVGYQNLFGIDGRAKTSQDALHLTQKSSAWWVRSTTPFENEPAGSAAHIAALAFSLDAGTSFIPLSHTNRFFKGVSACSSLDSSMRIVCADFRADEWILIEIVAEGGGEGRTVPVSRAWRADGRLLAIATQSCIMRFDKGRAAEKL